MDKTEVQGHTMRTYLFLASTALWPAFAVADTFTVPMVPHAVTVFPQGAKVMARTALAAQTGPHQIKFVVPPNVIQSRIPQFTLGGGVVTGLSGSTNLSEPVEAYYTQQESELMRQSETLANNQIALEGREQALTEERRALSAQADYLRAIRPSVEQPQSLENLQGIASYIPDALQENAKRIATVDNALQDLKEEADDLAVEIQIHDAIVAAAGLPTEDWFEITMDLTADGTGEVIVAMESFAQDAGWIPSYDIYLDEDGGTITFERQVQITQYTEQGWSDVAVTLSSAKPFQATHPRLPRRDIVQMFELAKRGVSYDRSSGALSEPLMSPEVVAYAVESAPASTIGKFDGVELVFGLPNRMDIASGRWDGSQPEIVPLSPLSLDVTVDRFANARHDKNAFVRVQIENTTGEPILSGDARLYRGSTLIGSRPISLIAAGAQDDMFFGTDQTLPITMKFLSEQTGDQGFFSQSNTRTEQVSFEVQNLGSETQDVVLTYALPISTKEDLEVETAFSTRPDRMDVDGEPGVSEWDVALEPGDGQTIGLTFEITWPEGSAIDWRP